MKKADQGLESAASDDTETSPLLESWPILPYPLQPIKHNPLIAEVALRTLDLRTRGVEKFIFTATTGRSGTLTLTRLFAALPECCALHEAHPIMHGPILQAASHGDWESVERVYHRIKAVNIRRAAIGHRYYFEANHLFIKTFAANAVADFGERLAVVHLVRPEVEVANSIYRLRDYPGTERGNYWWLDFRAPTNLLQLSDILLSDAEFSHPFYKGLWYWHEIEARIAAWRAAMPAVKVVDCETRWLNDLKRFCAVLSELGVRYDIDRLREVVGVKEHTKDRQKIGAGLPAEEAQHKAQRFRMLLEDLGPAAPRQSGVAGAEP